MLNELTIDGLRGVGRVELRFQASQRVHVLFGANGVGKTKCLEAIYQYLLMSNKEFLGFASRRLPNPSQFVMARMDAGTEAGALVVPAKKKDEMFLLENIWPKTKSDWHDLPVVFLGAAHRSSLAEQARGSREGAMLGTFTQRREAYFSGVYEALEKGRLASLGMTGDIRAWFVARAQSVNPYQAAADNRQAEIDAVLALLSEVDSRVDSRQMQIDGDGRVFLTVEGQLRELGELSSGFTSLVKLVQAIVAGYAAFTNEVNLQKVRGFVLIDEVESHLHVGWQSTVVSRLKQLLPNTVFFIATHSPIVLAQLQEGEAYLLRREADGVVRSEVIDSPNRRAFADVLESAFRVDLNALKREALEHDDQTEAKRALLTLLEQKGAAP